ncbi:MAG TPA: hypothetical protein VJZ78_05195 [Anaerolineales bacterium]|nr:hypothetical protein [Anaerolineales bacterium]
MKRFTIAIMLLMMTSLGCSLLSAEVNPADDQTQAQPAQADILFSDDFSDSNSGWDSYVADTKVTDYSNGSYRMFTSETQYDVWANPYQNFTEPVRIEVDATKINGPDDNDFGIICDYQDDNQNFHVGLISSDGYAVIAKMENLSWVYLSSDTMQAVDSIKQGAATNHIRFDCNQGNLTLYVNGTQIASAFDDTFIGGDVGLQVGTFDTGGTDILFDNFVVVKP